MIDQVGTPASLSDALSAKPGSSLAFGVAAHDIIRRLYPLCRSITGEGLRATLAAVSEIAPLVLTEVPSGTEVLDWTVPKEWKVTDAYIANAAGQKVVDFKANNLHLVSYSSPIRTQLTLSELRAHLHTLPEHPDWIPYRTSYYRETWGFCLSQRQLDSLPEGTYEVMVDSSLQDGGLTYGECVVPGSSDREVLVFTHCCHPSTCNDNLTGIAIAALLARTLATCSNRYTYRFIFAPATIGSITWLARNEHHLQHIEHGLILGLLGDAAPLTYKKSRVGTHPIDRVAEYVLKEGFAGARTRDFSPYGYDERQFCSPGFNLPVGRLTRSSNGEYPEYHSSADNLDFVSPAALGESYRAALSILAVLESNQVYVNVKPKGEPRLGKYGLYRATGGSGPGSSEYALLWVLNQCDGSRSLLEVAERAGLPYADIFRAAMALESAALLRIK